MGRSNDLLDQDDWGSLEEGCLEHMREVETRTLRVDIPFDLANLLDQCKLLGRKKKTEMVIEALRHYFGHLNESDRESP